jgi:hypothetical protein
MKLSTRTCTLLLLVISLAARADSSAPATNQFPTLKNAVVLIIRHAEKPDSGSGLTPAGEQRAAAYPDYFKHLTLDGQPAKPDYLFAAADGKNSHRPRLTITPTSQALGLPIDTRFSDKDSVGIVAELRSKPHGHAILIAWHHSQIPTLLRTFGADPDKLLPHGAWPEHVFGWLIELRYDANGQLIETKRINEKLMPVD